MYRYVFLPLVLISAGLTLAYGAPLESGFAIAPAEYSSQEEKIAAFQAARSQVVAAAALYEKTPYRYGGTDSSGIDCSGLVYASFKDALAVSVPRSTSGLYSWVEKINSGKLQSGDLVFFKTDNTGKVTHVGIYVGNNRFIHAASAGPHTGVIYSTLDEKYWEKAYIGAGRALPAANASDFKVSSNGIANGAAGKKDTPVSANSDGKGALTLGVAIAPSWKSLLTDEDNVFRGVAGQLRLGAETNTFPRTMIFGLELRPEWDITLGIFRLPITLSWGFNDKIRLFAGAAFSFGDAALETPDGERSYSSGENWLGAAGVTLAPVAFKISQGELAPYGELAWQSYFGNNTDKNVGADLAASFRFSTGLRYTWKVH